MNVLVSGGTGLIGKPFIASLLKKKHKVWVLSRNPQNAPLPPEVQVVEWDARSPKGWQHLLEDMNAIVNLAGENIGAGKWTPQRKQRILESRVQAGSAIVTALQNSIKKPGIFIQASAIGYYGQHQHDRVFDENSPPGDDYLAGVGKAWEESTRAVTEMGMRRIILRTGLVLTPHGGALKPMLLQYRLFAGGSYGSGEQWWSWIHLEDQVRAMLFLLEHPQANGPYNLVSPHPLTMKHFGKVLAKVINRPALIPTPAFALKTVLGDMSTLLLDGQKVKPAKLPKLGFTYKFPELNQALKNMLV